VERTVPHNLDAEKAVLGSILVDNSRLSQVMVVLRPSDFFRAAHVLIYETMIGLTNRSVNPDLLTLMDELRRNGRLDEVGGAVYITALTDGIPRSANAIQYARIVRDHSRLRETMQIGRWLTEKSVEADVLPAQLLAEASAKLSSVSTSESTGAIEVGEAVTEYVDALTAGTTVLPVPTGFIDLDALIQGLRSKELVIVAARPSVGKTAFGMRLCDSLARSGLPGVVFSLEVSVDKLAAQMVGWRSGVPSARVESGTASEEEFVQAGQAAASFSNVPLLLVESASTLLEVSGWCRRLRTEKQIKFVLIDYLQLLELGQRSENRQLEIAKISRGLKLLAKELDLVVIALSQLGRSLEGRKDKRPMLSDLRESGALEQDADLALLLFRPEMYSPKPEHAGLAEVIVAKNRNGPVGVVKMAFVKELARFDNLAREEET